jgi:hypothetical protein
MKIPNSAEVTGSSCFEDCQSLSSMSFQSNSRLTQIEFDASAVSFFETIVIPSQRDILGLDTVPVCTMSRCARAFLCGVSASESFFVFNDF